MYMVIAGASIFTYPESLYYMWHEVFISNHLIYYLMYKPQQQHLHIMYII
jgi:hypothetical protein